MALDRHDPEEKSSNPFIAARRHVPVPKYWLRRTAFVGMFAYISIAGLLGALPTLPELWERASESVVGVFDDNPEAALLRMVEQGKIRPARQADLDEWKSKAQLTDEDRRNLSLYQEDSFVVLESIRLPGGMYGAHSRSFFIPAGVPIPRGERAHNDFYLLKNGTCVGSAPGCTYL